MTALVGNAADCARVVLHLRPARRRIARFDAGPHSLSLLCDAVREGRVTAVVAIGLAPAAEARLRTVLGVLDLDISLYVSPLDGVLPEGQLFGILPVRPLARRPIPPWGRVLKGMLDRTVALLLLALLAPVLLGAGCAIRLDGHGPALRRHWREGRNGAAFPMLTFRPSAWTPGAHVLARAGLRRLPLLLNVLRGEMSLVGPRPHAVAMRAAGQPCAEIAPEYPARHRVKPGLTGLAQVAGLGGGAATRDDLRARLALDLAYIAEWSVWLDLKLLALTPWRAVFSARGAAV